MNVKGFNYNKVSELVGIFCSIVGCFLKKKFFKREVLKMILEVESCEWYMWGVIGNLIVLLNGFVGKFYNIRYICYINI